MGVVLHRGAEAGYSSQSYKCRFLEGCPRGLAVPMVDYSKWDELAKTIHDSDVEGKVDSTINHT
jgi:hypothetical protein